MERMRNFLVTSGVLIIILLMQVSCAPKRNLVYFSDLDNSKDFKVGVVNGIEPEIQSGDILSITVASLSAESNSLFNTGQIMGGNSQIRSEVSGPLREGYQVGKFGDVNFPVIGKVMLAGLTRDKAITVLTTAIEKFVKDPIVNVRFLNFKITVVGEVAKPSSFTVSNDKINVIEALGLAGDMTVYGKRENVLIIREENGERTMARLNLNDKSTLNSPYFYLKQNDMIYVEPVAEKARQASSAARVIPVVVGLTSIITLILTRVKF